MGARVGWAYVCMYVCMCVGLLVECHVMVGWGRVCSVLYCIRWVGYGSYVKEEGRWMWRIVVCVLCGI